MCAARQSCSDFSHRIYKNDPLLFRSYVDSEVDVTTRDGNVYTGVLYTVDPVSESVVLVQSEESKDFSLKVILGHAVKDIKIVSEAKTNVPELFLSAPVKISETGIAERKAAVKQLLLENRFPVTEESGVLHIDNIVSIEPPYGVEQCVSTNSIVLSRIQNLLNRVEK